MTRFPSKGLKALRAEFHADEAVVQIRIGYRDGSHAEIEGPVTRKEANGIMRLAMGLTLEGGETVDEAPSLGGEVDSPHA